MSKIADFCVSVDQPTPISPVYTAASRRVNLFSLFRRISGRDLLGRRRKAPAMQPLFKIEEPYVQNAPPLSDLHAQPGRNLLASASLETTWSTKLLWGSSPLTQNGFDWIQKERSFEHLPCSIFICSE